MALHVASETLGGSLGFISQADLNDASMQLLERWRSICACDMSIGLRGEKDEAYLAISRPVRTRPGKTPNSSQKVTEPITDELYDVDDGDEAAIHHNAIQPMVEYNVLFSLSYRVPVLYFFLRNLPSGTLKGGRKGVEAVYECLVPHHQLEAIQGVGVVGGIGMTNHPVTDVPCFWVHPCNTAKAMADIIWSPKPGIRSLDYLMLWLGLVGSGVGLHLPKELAMLHDSQVRLLDVPSSLRIDTGTRRAF